MARSADGNVPLQGDVSTNAQRAGRQSYLSHSGKVDFQPRQSVIVSCAGAEGGSRAEQKGGKLPFRGPIDFFARPFKRVTCVSVKVFRNLIFEMRKNLKARVLDLECSHCRKT